MAPRVIAKVLVVKRVRVWLAHLLTDIWVYLTALIRQPGRNSDARAGSIIITVIDRIRCKRV